MYSGGIFVSLCSFWVRTLHLRIPWESENWLLDELLTFRVVFDFFLQYIWQFSDYQTKFTTREGFGFDVSWMYSSWSSGTGVSSNLGGYSKTSLWEVAPGIKGDLADVWYLHKKKVCWCNVSSRFMSVCLSRVAGRGARGGTWGRDHGFVHQIWM